MRFTGEAKDFTRSLGAIVGSALTYAAEFKKRVLATKEAFHSMGAFWGMPSLPFKYKRAMVICKIQNTALTNTEAFIMRENDYDKLDCLVASYAKICMRAGPC